MKRYSQHQIEALLDKFMDGQTTVEEEAQLADYFRSGDVPAEWEDYRAMFNYFDRGMEGDLVPAKAVRKPLTALMGRRWWGIAAAACITAVIVGTALRHHPSSPDQPQVATTTPEIIQDSVSGQPLVTKPVETQILAATTTTPQSAPAKAHRNRKSARTTQRSLQAENAKLAQENERLQRELADLKRRAFIIDLEANGYKTVLNEDGNIVLIDLEQELENELNNKLTTTNIPAL